VPVNLYLQGDLFSEENIMRRDWMKKIVCGALAIVLVPTFAQAALLLDFNGLTGQTNGVGPTQSGWSGFTQPGPGSYDGITVTVSPIPTSVLQGRNRGNGNPANGGAFTLASMYQDFLYVDSGNGVNILIGGLIPNAQYDGRIWSYDWSQRNTAASTFATDWSVNSVLVAEDWSFAGWGLPTTDIDASFAFLTTANGSGEILITGARVTGNGVGINGLELTLVPEPTTSAMLVLGALCLAAGRRFRRRVGS